MREALRLRSRCPEVPRQYTVTLPAGGAQYVYSCGVASATRVSSNGVVNVMSGGSALGIAVNTGGIMNVFSGSTVTSTVVSGGSQNINNGAVAT